MTSAYGPSGSFGSRVSSKSIKHNTYKCIRSNFWSIPTPIHVRVHKYDLNYSYSRSHFSRFPQSFAKKIIHRLSRKVTYASKTIEPVIN